MMGLLIQKAHAAGYPGETAVTGTSFNHLLNNILSDIIIPIIYLIMALAVVYFVWGVLVFIQNADNPEKRADGYKHMIWGVIGIFIMVSANGIISIIKSTLGL